MQTVHDVVVIGSGAGGGTVTKVLADLGISVLLIEAGPMLSMADLKEHMWPYQVPHRGAGATGQALHRRPRPGSPTARRSAARSSKASPTPWRRAATSPGSARAFSAAARTTTAASRCAWPTTTSSRARRDGLGFDWPISYDDLAPYYDKAERFIGVTGQRGRHPQRAGRHLPPAGALRAHDMLVQRACAKHGIRAVAARQAVITSPRTAGRAVPLLRPVRARLHDRVELRGELRPDLPGDEDRPVQVIANAMARELITDASGQGHGRLLHRQDDRHRAAGALPHGRARGQRVRVGAPAAQFEVVAPSAGARELLRHGRPLPDGHRRLEHVGADSRAVGHAALQLGRLRLAPLRAVVALGQAQGAELPARLPHRSRRRLRHARHRLVHRHRQPRRGLRRCR